MVQGICEVGILVFVFQIVGIYVCNYVMYGLLYWLYQINDEIKGGFIYIFYLFEQVVNYSGVFSMLVYLVVIVLELVIFIVL